jgi:hypothetical protein
MLVLRPIEQLVMASRFSQLKRMSIVKSRGATKANVGTASRLFFEYVR